MTNARFPTFKNASKCSFAVIQRSFLSWLGTQGAWKKPWCPSKTRHLFISSVQSLSPVWLFVTPWTVTRQASLFITNSKSLLKFMSVESVMPSNHLILYCPFLLLPSVFCSIRVFSSESVLLIRWPKYQSFSFSISPSKEHSGLISFRIDWFDLCSPRDSQESSSTPKFKRINSSALSFLYGPTLTSIHDDWKNHRLDLMALCR